MEKAVKRTESLIVFIPISEARLCLNPECEAIHMSDDCPACGLSQSVYIQPFLGRLGKSKTDRN